MTDEEKRKVETLTKSINIAKAELLSEQRYMSNSDTYDTLTRIGELVSERNDLTGEIDDVKYFYVDDGEWYRVVAGFIGDDAERTDVNGVPLKIGDTVGLLKENGIYYPRLILSVFLSQEDLNKEMAVKLKDCTNIDIKDAFNAAYTVSLESCLEMYENSLDKRMEIEL